MSRAGHTLPSPWTYDAETEAVHDANGQVIGRFEPALGPLAAAAPELLEALENLENDDGLRMPDSAWELVQQAVEAATGRRKPSAAEMRGES